MEFGKAHKTAVNMCESRITDRAVTSNGRKPNRTLVVGIKLFPYHSHFDELGWCSRKQLHR